jgi:hypothetical protein
MAQQGQPIGWDESGTPIYAEPARQSQPPQPSTTGAGRIGDLAIGFGKDILSAGEAGGNLLRKIPGVDALSNMLPSVQLPEGVNEPSSDWQEYGGYLGMAAPGATLGKGALRAGANLVERKMVPGLTKRGADTLLDRGIGRVAEKNADAIGQLAKQTKRESTTVRQVGKNRREVPIWTKPSVHQPTADAMRTAVNAKGKSVLPELGGLVGTGALSLMGGGPATALGALYAAGRTLSRPRVATALAQGLHTAAPALGPLGGGGMSMAAQALMRLFGESEPQP